jgi:hypothetical protein
MHKPVDQDCGSISTDIMNMESEDLVGLESMPKPVDLSITSEKMQSGGLIKGFTGNVQGQYSANDDGGHYTERGWFDLHAFDGPSREDDTSVTIQYGQNSVVRQK